MNERELLEAKTKEELIEEVLARRQEVQNLETELAGTNEAEEISDTEADKYALLLTQADSAIHHVVNETDKYDDEARRFIEEALARHALRSIGKS